MTQKDRSGGDEKHEQPLDVLSGMAKKRIIIRLTDKTEVVGQLLDFDQYMNLKIGLEGEEVLIRGNNVMLIGTEWEEAQAAAGNSG
jgi:small nuclear ribonucleoprotein (snRNP)-like protein